MSVPDLIRSDNAAGVSYNELARRYAVGKSTIARIVRNQRHLD